MKGRLGRICRGTGSLLLACGLLPGTAVGEQPPQATGLGPAIAAPVSSALASPPVYANLPDLTSRICMEAARTFSGFFDAAPIEVQSFLLIGGMSDDSSTLGVMLADQMRAELNSLPRERLQVQPASQTVVGVLQEVDGYLRVHLQATNGQNKRSHVSTIEMSEPLYRALHTWVQADRREKALNFGE